MDDIERILAQIPYDMPQSEVAYKLASMMLTIRNRMLSHNHSPKCNGRAEVCRILDTAYDSLADFYNKD